jgi:hypothetical protein
VAALVRFRAQLDKRQAGPEFPVQVVAAGRRCLVISRDSDHAANERTFLAWVRTGIATIAFGFVIEKFNLFMLTIAAATPGLGREHARSAGCRGCSASMTARS